MSLLESPMYNHSEITSSMFVLFKSTVVNSVFIMCSKNIMELQSLSLIQMNIIWCLLNNNLLVEIMSLTLGWLVVLVRAVSHFLNQALLFPLGLYICLQYSVYPSYM